MFTRVLSISIAVIFVLQAIFFAVYMFVQTNNNDGGQTNLTAEEQLKNYSERLAREGKGKLADFEPLDGAIDEVRFEDLATGSGTIEVNSSDQVTFFYTGAFARNGQIFESNTDQEGKTAGLYNLARDLGPGLADGLVGMKVNGKRRIFVPAGQAYGQLGKDPVVPPDTDLVFDVELTAISDRIILEGYQPIGQDVSEVSFEDLEVGSGNQTVIEGDTVSVSYTVAHASTGQILSSNSVDQPEFNTLSAIRGWQEGLLGMKVGGKRRLVVPKAFNNDPALYYPNLQLDQDLVFDIELKTLKERSVLADFTASDERVQSLEKIDQRIGQAAQEVAEGDTVIARYTGALVRTGIVFDSSGESGSEFSLDPDSPEGVIRGWQQGLVGMKVGGKRRLLIPANLAYGPAGREFAIPPDADLVFDIELLEIK